jgi:hypothetical protein
VIMTQPGTSPLSISFGVSPHRRFAVRTTGIVVKRYDLATMLCAIRVIVVLL